MKLDDGFKESEKLLNQLEKDVHDVYAQATKEMTEKVDNYFAKYKAEDEKQRAKYEQGEITKKEYTEWRQRKMLAGKQYVQMRDTLARDLTNTDSIAMKMVGDKMIDVYALNMNYETYNIEHETRLDTSFSLYNHDSVERLIKTNPAILPIPKPDKMLDYKWNKQHLQSALTQGILQGESITKIAKRFQNVSGMDERAAIRNARTAMTGAQNGGRLDAMERANENGVEVKKGWMATLDDRTRDSHVELDGEEREIDEEFSNGVMFPGDPEGEPAEVYNCRCRMIHVYPKHPVDWSDLSLRNTDKLGDMTYEEWKNKHKEVDDG
jgi:SPP1 gp7 family putative phage head morphogenesis protein